MRCRDYFTPLEQKILSELYYNYVITTEGDFDHA